MSKKGFSNIPTNRPDADAEVVPYQADVFFDASYRHNRNQELTDRDTIGPFVTLLDARFHFNSVENSIIRALTHIEPIPQRGVLVRAWEYAKGGGRLLDVGSGSGHWISFFREIGLVKEAVGCEIAPRSLEHLRNHFDDDADTMIIEHDISQASPKLGHFDYICAIGVMFHIVEDERWRMAITNLASMLKSNGLLFVGGEFGVDTRNVQFHAEDAKPMRDVAPEDGIYRISKRVRSLADWEAAAKIGWPGGSGPCPHG